MTHAPSRRLRGRSVAVVGAYDGPLGTGATLEHTLSEGATSPIHHHLTVTVTDAEGRTASDTILIHVGSVG